MKSEIRKYENKLEDHIPDCQKSISLSKVHKWAENGEPLARVPHGQTVPWTVWPPLLSLWES